MENIQDGVEPVDLSEDYTQLQFFLARQDTIELLHSKGIKEFFPIQFETYDATNYRQDLIGRDRTGSGKTIAYSLPVLERFRDQRVFEKEHQPRFLVLLPTRELATQVAAEIESLKLFTSEYTVLAIYGGIPINEHLYALRRGIDVIVATPGRMIDLLERDVVNLRELDCVCLDEADQMLKQGFQEDVERIFGFIRRRCPRKTQNLLFSATIPAWVQQLARQFLDQGRKLVDLVTDLGVKTSITVDHLCMCSSGKNIKLLLPDFIAAYAGPGGSYIIFSETKRKANQIISSTKFVGETHVLHGDIPQNQREVTFRQFRTGKIKGIVATNVAARGLDIPSVDLILQLQPPKNVDDYIHRAGRTGRAGKSGYCVTFYLEHDRYLLKQIQRTARIKMKSVNPPDQLALVKAAQRGIISELKQVKYDVLDIFQDSAEELIKQFGAKTALLMALAKLTGTVSKLAQPSIVDSLQGYISYILTCAASIQEKDLIEYLQDKLEVRRGLTVKSVKRVNANSIVFNLSDTYRSRMMQVIEAQSANKGVLSEMYSLQLVTSLEMLEKCDEDTQSPYSEQQYEQAIRDKKNLELFVGRLTQQVDEAILFKFFKNNGVTVININLLRKDNEESKCAAFVLCINKDNYDRCLALNGSLLERKQIQISRPRGSR